MKQAPTRRTTGAQALAQVVLVLLLVVTATACGGNKKAASPAPSTPSASASTPPADQPVTVTGLPNGVSAEVIDTSPGVENGDNLDFVSQVYSLALTGAIDRPVTARVQLNNAQPAATPVVVATRVNDTQPWAYQPGRLTSDLQHVEYTTTTLNQVGVLAMDLETALTSLQQDLSAELGSGIDKSVTRPTCQGADLARKDGYSVASSSSRTLFWCFGLENKKRVVKVTNRRIVPLQVVHPKVPVISAPPAGTSYAGWPGVLGTAYTFLPPTRTVTYDADLQPKTQLGLTAAYGAGGQSLRLLQAAVRALTTRLNRFGTGSASVTKAVSGLLALPQCAKSIGKGSDALLTGCLAPPKLLKVFGARSVLLRPLLGDRRVRPFLRAQAQALVASQQSEQQRIVVKRAAPDFSAFTGIWSGHTRSMAINGQGVVSERLNDGCCTLVINLTYQLADPTTQGATSTAKATITAVKVGKRKKVNGRVPRVGDTGVLTVRNGVVRPPFLKTNYCNKAAAKKGTCGA